MGNRIDAGHPQATAYLAMHSGTPTTAPASKRTKAPKRTPAPTTKALTTEVPGIADNGTAQSMADVTSLSLRDIGERFGGDPQFINWIKALNLVETVRGRRLDNEEAERTLVLREFVEAQVLGLLEELHQRLLHETPKSLARVVQSQAKAGAELAVSEREIRKQITKVLETSRDKINKRLRKL